MASSGTGTSWTADFTRCQRYFYWRYRHAETGISVVGAPAAPLLVGQAAHAYLEHWYRHREGIWSDPTVNEPLATMGEARSAAQHAFHSVLDALPGEQRTDELDARATLALAVLDVRCELMEDALQAGERTLVLEHHMERALPPGPVVAAVRNELLMVTGRVDRIADNGKGDGLLLDDWKTTGAMDLVGKAREYVMSDQHLAYAWLWHEEQIAQGCAPIESNEAAFAQGRTIPASAAIGCVRYCMIRLHKAITPKSFHVEERRINAAQVADWLARTIALRAHLSAQWEAPRVAWAMASHPGGPCFSWGRACAYLTLCRRPDEAETLAQDSLTYAPTPSVEAEAEEER